MKTSRRKRYLLFALFAACVIVMLAITQIPWGRLTGNRLVISRDTTRLLAPRASDGTIDYLAYLNGVSSDGVTPENNAIIELAAVMGDDAWLNRFPASAAEERLGARIPIEGPTLSTLEEFLFSSGYWSAIQVKGITGEDFRAAYGPWTKDELPQCYKWMKSSEAGLDRIVVATGMTRYDNPLIAPEDPPLLGACSLPMTENLRFMSQALIVRAMYSLGAGRAEDCARDLRAVRTLLAFSRQDQTMGGQNNANAIAMLLVSAELEMLRHGDLRVETLDKYCAASSLPDTHAVSIRQVIDQCLRFVALDTLQKINVYGARRVAASSQTEHCFAMAGNGIPNQQEAVALHHLHGLVDWNQAMITVNQWADRLVEILDCPDDLEMIRQLTVFNDELDDVRDKARARGTFHSFAVLAIGPGQRGRLAGEIAVSDVFRQINEQIETRMEVEIAEEISLTAMALELFRRKQGRLPRALGELVPEYMPKIPLDPFTGKPVIYRTTDSGFVLYSVGRDQVDDGGLTTDGPKQPISTIGPTWQPDIGVRIEATASQPN